MTERLIAGGLLLLLFVVLFALYMSMWNGDFWGNIRDAFTALGLFILIRVLPLVTLIYLILVVIKGSWTPWSQWF